MPKLKFLNIARPGIFSSRAPDKCGNGEKAQTPPLVAPGASALLRLVEQQFVKNEPGVKKTVQQVIDEAAKKLGDKIAIRRYARFQLGA